MNTTTKTQLEIFRESYPSIRVFVEQDFLVYKVSRGMAEKAAKVANGHIYAMGLDLVAIPSKFNDSFQVKSNLTLDI